MTFFTTLLATIAVLLLAALLRLRYRTVHVKSDDTQAPSLDAGKVSDRAKKLIEFRQRGKFAKLYYKFRRALGGKLITRAQLSPAKQKRILDEIDRQKKGLKRVSKHHGGWNEPLPTSVMSRARRRYRAAIADLKRHRAAMQSEGWILIEDGHYWMRDGEIRKSNSHFIKLSQFIPLLKRA